MSSTAKSLPRVDDAKIVPLNAESGAPGRGQARPPDPRPPVEPRRLARMLEATKRYSLNVLPPMLAVGAIVALWELLCAAPDAR